MDKETAKKIAELCYRNADEGESSRTSQFMLDLLMTGSAAMPDGEVVRLTPEPAREPTAKPAGETVPIVLERRLHVWVWDCPKCRTEHLVRPETVRSKFIVPGTVTCRECYETFKTRERHEQTTIPREHGAGVPGRAVAVEEEVGG